ncbi:MAG: hypothetical protein HWQ44_00080 [Nostoc sp. JL34]|nr:hypothetical protein [Nostoc sp. JL34]
MGLTEKYWVLVYRQCSKRLELHVKTWDGELTVGLKHLKSCDYLPSECEQMQLVCDA